MILLDHVTKIYPGDEEPALDNVSLHIEPHEFVFLVGKSGAITMGYAVIIIDPHLASWHAIARLH